MNSSRTLSLLVLLVPGLALLAAPAPAAPVTPTLVAVRAAHHPGFDRVVFVFRGGLAASRRVGYVRTLLGGGSGSADPGGRPGRAPGQPVPGSGTRRRRRRHRRDPAGVHDARRRDRRPGR